MKNWMFMAALVFCAAAVYAQQGSTANHLKQE
jgi:hypothetical protein